MYVYIKYRMHYSVMLSVLLSSRTLVNFCIAYFPDQLALMSITIIVTVRLIYILSELEMRHKAHMLFLSSFWSTNSCRELPGKR